MILDANFLQQRCFENSAAFLLPETETFRLQNVT